MPTFYVQPSPARNEIESGVIRPIIEAHQRLLPRLGWTEVEVEYEADLVVGHLGTRSTRLDVFHLHGLYPTGMMDLPKGYWASNTVIIENLRRAKNVICVSDWVAQLVRRDMHLDPFVCGHGIDLDSWDRIVPEDSPEPYVLWNKIKTTGVCDPTPVLELASRLPKIFFLATWLPDGAKVPRNVRVTGLLPSSRMWPLVKGASVYLATTKETFGVGILEAMASGVPVVASNWGAVPGIIKDAGIIVEPRDYDAMAVAVEEALERHQELGDLGRKVVQEYTWDAVVERLAQIYEQCLPRPATGPRVTIVIPCYNYAQFVAEAIASVRAQTYEQWELVVVDDGSSDNSVEVIKASIADEPRAKLLEQDNQGVARARNAGIAAGTGEYVVCLDADDTMEPTFVDVMVGALDQDPKLGLAYSGLRIMAENGSKSDRVHQWPTAYDPTRGMKGNQVPTCVMYRRSTWKHLGGYRQRFAPHGAGTEDGDFWVRILAAGGGAMKVTDEALFNYRVHGKSATRSHPEDWKKESYYEWMAWQADGLHPIASQLGLPVKGSWPVRDYDQPRISVIIPVGHYHKAHMIEAIDSVEAQTYRHWELIVVNDTGDPLDLSAWPYAKLVNTEKGSMGPGHARNIGTEVASAPLVVYLDADDILQPRFLEETLRLWLDAGGWIYTDFFYITDAGEHRTWQAPEWEAGRLWDKGLCAVTCLYPIQAWKDIGGFDEAIPHEDWDFHIKLVVAGWCGSRLAEPLITYRHDTGKRREECIADKGFKQIKARYTKEALMGCGCGKGGGTKHAQVKRAAPSAGTPVARAPTTRVPVTRAPVASAEEAPAPEGMALDTLPPRTNEDSKLAMYVGKSDTDLMFTGRSGKVYIFSSKRRFAWIDPIDVGRLSSKAVLRMIDLTQLHRASPELQLPT